MGAYTVFEELRDTEGAHLVFGIVDLCMFCVTLGACLFGLWRMRALQYRLHAHGEFIDEILLIVGLIGEIVYCVVGMKSSFGISEYGGATYTSLIHAVAPLLVFYRFHSSACLAEIWKHTYTTKLHESHPGGLLMTDSNLTLETTERRKIQ
ncbi:hypothetical protein ANCCEY_12111 [Ancylostoma ceylanicum]|uniref:Uncharacterized protein n=1 Tax=Ancylostoma ceylanicum TaxID=53326 RepID=A0A0D6LFW5_9BILA|nr:hypothetical protein ANCCEY_12111 [Ancylostoma ceylanicum]